MPSDRPHEPSTTPRVAVVIVTWNALPLLKRCLPSVVASTWPNLEIVLADNASTDGSSEWVAMTYPGVRIVRHPENWGFCRGNNEAIRLLDAEYVVLLNNDVEVDAGWLEPLVAAAEDDPVVAVLQPKLLDFNDRGRFEYAGAAGGHLDRLGYPFARGRVFFETEPDTGQYDRPEDVFWASGAAMFLRRKALDEVGLLDEAFEFHMEEIDLCWRLQRAGYRVRCEPSSRVWHMGGGSLDRSDPRKSFYNFRNSLLMLYKNLSSRDWMRVFPQRLILDSIAGLRFLLRGEFRAAWSVPHAYMAAHVMKGRYVPPATTTVRPSYRGRIVIDYFLRGLRTFEALPKDRFNP